MIIDVECYNPAKNSWAQAMFLVHGSDDVYWTDDPEAAAKYVLEELISFKTATLAAKCEEPCEKFSGVFQF